MNELNKIISDLGLNIENEVYDASTQQYISIKYNGERITYLPDCDQYRVDDCQDFYFSELLEHLDAFQCDDCNRICWNDSSHSVNECSRIVCDDCFDDHYAYCDRCDYGPVNTDDLYWDEDNERWLCQNCWDETHSCCDCCDTEYNNEDLNQVFFEDGSCDRVCEHCLNNAEAYTNRVECSRCHTYNIGRTICGNCYNPLPKSSKRHKRLTTCDCVLCYHPRVDITCIDNYRKILDMQNFKGYGIELEINKDDSNQPKMTRVDEVDVISKINNFLGGHAYYSHDGSLSNGFEIVTQPHTEKAMHNIKWEKLFEMLKKENFTDNSKQAGYHIHISRSLFGDTEEEIQDNIAKLIYFFEKNKVDLVKLSRRENTRWCPFYTDQANFYYSGSYLPQKTPEISEQFSKDISERKICCIRGAVNLRSSDSKTVEIRLFRSTLNYKEFMGSFDFITTLVNNIKNISWKCVNNLNKWLKGLSTVGREYLKSKQVLGVK